MSVNQFLVYYRDPPDADKKQQIESATLVNGVYQLSDRDFIIRSDLADPKHVCEIVGITTGDQAESVSGVVFRLNGSHWGYFNKGLWSWLRGEGNATESP